MDTKTITQLSKLFRARFPYIYITTWEEDRAISLIKKMVLFLLEAHLMKSLNQVLLEF